MLMISVMTTMLWPAIIFCILLSLRDCFDRWLATFELKESSLATPAWRVCGVLLLASLSITFTAMVFTFSFSWLGHSVSSYRANNFFHISWPSFLSLFLPPSLLPFPPYTPTFFSLHCPLSLSLIPIFFRIHLFFCSVSSTRSPFPLSLSFSPSGLEFSLPHFPCISSPYNPPFPYSCILPFTLLLFSLPNSIFPP